MINTMSGNIFNNYSDYLLSDEWKEKSKIYKRKYCECCFKSKFLTVHHKDYENIGFEKKYHVITLCRKCHTNAHLSGILQDMNLLRSFSEYENFRIMMERLL